MIGSISHHFEESQDPRGKQKLLISISTWVERNRRDIHWDSNRESLQPIWMCGGKLAADWACCKLGSSVIQRRRSCMIVTRGNWVIGPLDLARGRGGRTSLRKIVATALSRVRNDAKAVGWLNTPLSNSSLAELSDGLSSPCPCKSPCDSPLELMLIGSFEEQQLFAIGESVERDIGRPLGCQQEM